MTDHNSTCIIGSGRIRRARGRSIHPPFVQLNHIQVFRTWLGLLCSRTSPLGYWAPMQVHPTSSKFVGTTVPIRHTSVLCTTNWKGERDGHINNSLDLNHHLQDFSVWSNLQVLDSAFAPSPSKNSPCLTGSQVQVHRPLPQEPRETVAP